MMIMSWVVGARMGSGTRDLSCQGGNGGEVVQQQLPELSGEVHAMVLVLHV